MSSRQLVVLGTASQAPTRFRNHNGYLLRWDNRGFLFDPGEGTQRQLTLAGVAASRINDICITHMHGDHCLGLPGILQRLSIDTISHPIQLRYPEQGQIYIDRLRYASVYEERAEIHNRPVSESGIIDESPALILSARQLDHRIPTYGYRVDEPDGRRLVRDRLDEAGIRGPAVGELRAHGQLRVGGRRITLEEMSDERPGQSAAFAMDTRLCDGLRELAEGVDMLICESTFVDAEADLAEAYGHMTAAQAATVAREAGVRRLVLTHFSQRHPDTSVFLAEAAPIFPEVIAAEDLLCVPLPARPGSRPSLGPT